MENKWKVGNHYVVSSIDQLEGFIESFVPKLFYELDYGFEHGLTVYVPKKYINVIDQFISKKLTVTRHRVLDIASKECVYE